VLQLAYDMRRWKSLEATGRSGSDDGLDIRATETVVDDVGNDDEDDPDAASEPSVVGERLWIFQCKREKTLAAKRVREIVKESLVCEIAASVGRRGGMPDSADTVCRIGRCQERRACDCPDTVWRV
jgi:hypothetical protein